MKLIVRNKQLRAATILNKLQGSLKMAFSDTHLAAAGTDAGWGGGSSEKQVSFYNPTENQFLG